MSDEKKAKDECLHPAHKAKAAVRGLCKSCYSVACKLVKDGQITWDALEKAGKALKAKPKNRTSQAWLLEGSNDAQITPEPDQTADQVLRVLKRAES